MPLVPFSSCRVLQISDLVRECLGQPDAACTISPAPPDSCEEDSTSTIIQRCACKVILKTHGCKSLLHVDNLGCKALTWLRGWQHIGRPAPCVSHQHASPPRLRCWSQLEDLSHSTSVVVTFMHVASPLTSANPCPVIKDLT